MRGMCDVYAAHGDRAADVDAHGNSLHEDETRFPFDARVECCSLVGKNPSWFAQARRKAVVFLGFQMSLKEKKTKKFTVKAPRC